MNIRLLRSFAAGSLWAIITFDFHSVRERWILMRLQAEFELVEVQRDEI